VLQETVGNEGLQRLKARSLASFFLKFKPASLSKYPNATAKSKRERTTVDKREKECSVFYDASNPPSVASKI